MTIWEGKVLVKCKEECQPRHLLSGKQIMAKYTAFSVGLHAIWGWEPALKGYATAIKL